MSQTKKGLVLPLAAVAILLLMIAGMAGYFTDKMEPGIRDITVVEEATAVEVRRLAGTVFETVPASVAARETTRVSSRLLARITSMEVRAGDYVNAGQLLVTLESGDLDAREQQAREQVRAVDARLTEARQNLERAMELHQRGLIAVADRDAAQANASSLEADLAASRQALQEAESARRYAQIRSPIAGRVVDRFAEPGDTASPGETLLSLYNPFSLWVEARVREKIALPLASGQELAVEVPSLGKTLNARIEEIVPAADPGSRSFLVKATLPEEQGLLPGMYASIRVPAGERARLVVPLNRVAQVGQIDVVWVENDGAVERRIVRLGQPLDDDLIEVVAGLEDGDKVFPRP